VNKIHGYTLETYYTGVVDEIMNAVEYIGY